MDKIIKIEPSSQKNKKYKATIKGDNGEYTVHFGDSRYQQYKDITDFFLFYPISFFWVLSEAIQKMSRLMTTHFSKTNTIE